jgi:hypothetical protein
VGHYHNETLLYSQLEYHRESETPSLSRIIRASSFSTVCRELEKKNPVSSLLVVVVGKLFVTHLTPITEQRGHGVRSLWPVHTRNRKMEGKLIIGAFD